MNNAPENNHEALKPLSNRPTVAPRVDVYQNNKEYLLLADYRSYIDCQDKVDKAYRDQEHWAKMSILNAARMGKFSSDRSIREYCETIWKTKPVSVDLEH